VAAALRLVLVLLVPAVPSWDGVIYVRAAEQLAAGEGYTQRILHEANSPRPTAFYPVGFPAVLALVRLAGGGLRGDRLLQVAASCLLVPVAYLYARRVRHRRAGRAAAWATALWPGGIFLSATWLAEPVFALGVGLALLPYAYARRRRVPHTLLVAALGLGLIGYLRASSLPMVSLLGLAAGYDAVRTKPPLRRTLVALVAAGALTAVAVVPLLPWAVRNYRLLGAPVLVSTNGGVNLLLGTRGEGGFVTLDPNEPCKNDPLREVERDRCYDRRAKEAILQAPFSWLARGLLKFAHTFGHESAMAQCFGEGLLLSPAAREAWRLWALGLCRVGYLPLLGAAFMGGWQVARRGSRRMRAILFAPMLALAALHVTYLGGDRYHAAVAPMMLALAGVGFADRLRRPARQI
jgi:4-amino-4-deoxy-L-arabinose transferase-like glycosyltransferase